ncbi:hypothetical protein [Sphaerisporangium perillae]|uniref:hypothetical protein n=1 Tax=Sphaerisporangium perillae TaxID=2935860 RepID=UPI00200DA945|nr:hypothetical protein [Sphaerisporangium perillae]
MTRSSPLFLQDFHSLDHVGDDVIRVVVLAGPITVVDPDRSETGREDLSLEGADVGKQT